ncbi:uncharacterized protein ACMZJ9_019325 [Mantella aurantiaca]
MSYSNEMRDQEGYPWCHPSPPQGVPPPIPSNPPPAIYEMPICFPDSLPPLPSPPKYPCGNLAKPGLEITPPTMAAHPQPACKDYLAWSIASLILCNIIFGIVAVIFSCKTRNARRSGDLVSAASHSRKAFIFNMTALILGIILHVAWITVVIYQSVGGNNYYDHSFTDNSVYHNGFYYNSG